MSEPYSVITSVDGKFHGVLREADGKVAVIGKKSVIRLCEKLNAGKHRDAPFIWMIRAQFDEPDETYEPEEEDE